MPRTRRPPTRVEQLAAALQAVQESQAFLDAVDLRTCGKDLRTTVKASRAGASELAESIHQALTLDEPPAPKARVAAGT